MTVIASVAGCYEALIPLRVEHVFITIDGLREPVRIALLGDLHVGLFTRPSRLKQFFETTRELHPDVVILAGDLVDDDPYYAPKLLVATRHLHPRTPLLAVLGNHEMYGDPFGAIAALRGSRIHLLVNEGVAFRSLWIAGISDYAGQQKALRPDIPRALQGAPPGMVPILIAHQPYHMGWYQRGVSQLYVNTGTGFWLVPFRLGMTGEITIVELRPGPRRNSLRP